MSRRKNSDCTYPKIRAKLVDALNFLAGRTHATIYRTGVQDDGDLKSVVLREALTLRDIAILAVLVADARNCLKALDLAVDSKRPAEIVQATINFMHVINEADRLTTENRIINAWKKPVVLGMTQSMKASVAQQKSVESHYKRRGFTDEQVVNKCRSLRKSQSWSWEKIEATVAAEFGCSSKTVRNARLKALRRGQSA